MTHPLVGATVHVIRGEGPVGLSGTVERVEEFGYGGPLYWTRFDTGSNQFEAALDRDEFVLDGVVTHACPTCGDVHLPATEEPGVSDD